MMNNHRRQVVQVTVSIAVASAGQVSQQIVTHVQAIDGELHECVHLGAS